MDTTNGMLTFRSMDGRAFKARVRNPRARLTDVAGRLAVRAGYAGTVELISTQTGQNIKDDVALEDLPVEDRDITFAPESTPA